jgi:hypothetical protein
LRFTPSTAEWADATSPYTSFNIDPILATDPMTGLTLAGGDDGSCSILAVTKDDGQIAYLGADRPGTGSLTPFDDGQDNPVQLGLICDTGTRCINGRNLLDFMDAGVTRDGHVIIGYANGCEGGCPADPTQVAQSTHAWGVVALQTSGPSLFR